MLIFVSLLVFFVLFCFADTTTNIATTTTDDDVVVLVVVVVVCFENYYTISSKQYAFKSALREKEREHKMTMKMKMKRKKCTKMRKNMFSIATRFNFCSFFFVFAL